MGNFLLEEKPLFNEQGHRDASARRLLRGSTTNMLEFNRFRYGWADPLYRKMRGFTWFPEEIALGEDKKQFEELTPDERDAFLKILAFLIFLDSIQADNVGRLAQYITAPEVAMCLVTQQYFETIHAQSYDYILTSIVDSVTRDSVYDMWRDNELLLRRNRLVTDWYEQFLAEKDGRTFVRALWADVILEGLYFYSGFSFFYGLGRQGKMIGTMSIIRLINRDENLHLGLFVEMFRELLREEPELFTPELLNELKAMTVAAAEQEIEWGKYVVGNRILGITDKTLNQYIRYLANHRSRLVGFVEPFPGVVDNPMQWVDNMSTQNNVKTDFFEQRVTNYQKSGSKQLGSLRRKTDELK